MPSPMPLSCSVPNCTYTTPEGAPTWELISTLLGQHTSAVHVVNNNNISQNVKLIYNNITSQNVNLIHKIIFKWWTIWTLLTATWYGLVCLFSTTWIHKRPSTRGASVKPQKLMTETRVFWKSVKRLTFWEPRSRKGQENNVLNSELSPKQETHKQTSYQENLLKKIKAANLYTIY